MSKNSGIVRKLDNMGRVVIPAEIRKCLQMQDSDPVDISVSGHCIHLRPVRRTCRFCGKDARAGIWYRDYPVCPRCAGQIRLIAERKACGSGGQRHGGAAPVGADSCLPATSSTL